MGTEKENERENPAALHSTVKGHSVRVSRIYCINQLSGIIPKALPSAHKLRKAARMSVCSVLFAVLSNVLTNCFSRRRSECGMSMLPRKLFLSQVGASSGIFAVVF